MSNIYGDPWTGMQVTVIGGEVALWTHTWSEFESIWPNNPLQTVSSPGTATPTSLISEISRSIGWAMFNTTPTTRTEWQAGPLQSDAAGNLKTDLGTKVAGEDITNDRLKTEYRGTPAYISTATTTVVKSGAGHLHSLVVNGGTAGTIIGYDNTAASGDIVFSFDSTNALATYMFDVSFTNGLTIVTGAATKVSVSFR